MPTIDKTDLSNWLSSLRDALASGGDTGFSDKYDQLFETDEEFQKLVVVLLLLTGDLQVTSEMQAIIDQQSAFPTDPLTIIVKIAVDVITATLSHGGKLAIESLAKKADMDPNIDPAEKIYEWNIRDQYIYRFSPVYKQMPSRAENFFKRFFESWNNYLGSGTE